MAPPKNPKKPKKKPSFDSPAETKRSADTGWVYRTDGAPKGAAPAAPKARPRAKVAAAKPAAARTVAKPVATKAARARVVAAGAAPPGSAGSRFERAVSLAATPFEILVHIAMAPLDWKRRR